MKVTRIFARELGQAKHLARELGWAGRETNYERDVEFG